MFIFGTSTSCPPPRPLTGHLSDVYSNQQAISVLPSCNQNIRSTSQLFKRLGDCPLQVGRGIASCFGSANGLAQERKDNVEERRKEGDERKLRPVHMWFDGV